MMSGGRIPADSEGMQDTDLTVVNVNLLHGFNCDAKPAPHPSATQCRLDDRIDLLFRWLQAVGCPDIVTLQEIVDTPFALSNPERQLIVGPLISARRLIETKLPALSQGCGFTYHIVFKKAQGTDEELILSRYPILKRKRYDLHSVFGNPLPLFDRHVLYARIDHPLGPVDVFTPHLSSGSDSAREPCEVNIQLFPGLPYHKACPAACVKAGAQLVPPRELTVRECQAVQVVQLVEKLHTVSTPAIIAGDFNATPGSFEYQQFTSRGYLDVYLAAGNAECDPATGGGCTAGRPDTLAALLSPTTHGDRRIDFIFLVLPAADSRCAGRLDLPIDGDGDGAATRVFAAAANPFVPCGDLSDTLCWISDHQGIELDLNCTP
jgi:endonuclease/exonuclease/phosphatase family metal-dependent hydrolase